MSYNRGGYIGRAPSDSSVTVSKQYFEPTGAASTFTFSAGYDPGYLEVYRNGVKLVNPLDYAATDGSTITLTTPVGIGTTVEAIATKAYNVSNVEASTLNTTCNGTNLILAGDLTVEGDIEYDEVIGRNVNLSGVTTTVGLNVTGIGTFVDINVSGAVTANAFVGDGSALTGIGVTQYTDTGSLVVAGVSTLTGNVLVGASATVGFGSTVFFKDGNKLYFGDGEDLSIYHDGSHSYIDDTGTGGLYIDASGLTLRNANDENYAIFTSDGSTDLYFNNSKKFETTNTGSIITGILTVTSDVSIGGTLTYEDVTNIDSVGVVTARAGVNVSGGQLIVGSGITMGIAGVSTFSGTSDVHLLDNVQLNVGDASDLVIKHDGTQSQITESGTGLLYINSNTTVIRNSAGNENQITAEGNGAVKLYYDNSAKIETTNDGTVTTGIATATLGAVVSGGTLTIPTVAGTNNNAAQAVLFQTSAGVVDGGSGLTYNPANDVLTINGADISAQMFRGSAGSVTLANDNNSSTESVVVTDKVTLNHGGSAVLETTDDGMTVQKGITVRGIEGGDAQIRIEADEADNASDRFRLVATDSAGFFIQSYDGSQYDNLFGGYLNGASELYHNNTKCLETRADAGIEATSGNFIVGTSGRGLQFDTADSGSDQLLDDYEEGDHTAAMTLGSGSITTTHSNTLTYTKVGRLVTVTGRLYVELSASDVTSFQFTLPFTCANVGTKVESMNLFHVFRATAQSNESNEAIRAFRIDGNTNFAKMVDRDNGTYGEFGVTNPHIGVNIQYYTAT